MTVQPTLTPTTSDYPGPGWDLTLTVYGTPAGQGAVTFLGKGRPTVHSNRTRLLPWRRAIITAAHQHRTLHGPRTLAGVPVETDLTITVTKPKSAPKRRRTWPITRASSDLDHHVRAIHDALTDANVIGDDAQIVTVTARKTYPREHPLALETPGALIRLRVPPDTR